MSLDKQRRCPLHISQSFQSLFKDYCESLFFIGDEVGENFYDFRFPLVEPPAPYLPMIMTGNRILQYPGKNAVLVGGAAYLSIGQEYRLKKSLRRQHAFDWHGRLLSATRERGEGAAED